MHPILFQIPTPWGAVPIYSYGFMLGSSLLFAWYFIMWMGKRKENFNPDIMANCFTITAICAIVGARLLYIFTNLSEFDSLSKWFQIRSGGLVAYGGFIGGFVGSWAYLRYKKIPLLPWADLVAPVLGSGLMLTRIGCYLYGCDYGKLLADDAPSWLKKLGTFPKWDFSAAPKLACDQTLFGSPAFQHHVTTYFTKITPAATESLPVHPTQIYESLAGLAIFLLGLIVFRYRQFRGQVFFVVASTYAVWRYFIEYLRDDPERGSAFGFSTSQLISMAIWPLCVAGYLIVHKRYQERGDLAVPKHAQIPSA